MCGCIFFWNFFLSQFFSEKQLIHLMDRYKSLCARQNFFIRRYVNILITYEFYQYIFISLFKKDLCCLSNLHRPLIYELFKPLWLYICYYWLSDNITLQRIQGYYWKKKVTKAANNHILMARKKVQKNAKNALDWYFQAYMNLNLRQQRNKVDDLSSMFFFISTFGFSVPLRLRKKSRLMSIS